MNPLSYDLEISIVLSAINMVVCFFFFNQKIMTKQFKKRSFLFHISSMWLNEFNRISQKQSSRCGFNLLSGYFEKFSGVSDNKADMVGFFFFFFFFYELNILGNISLVEGSLN